MSAVMYSQAVADLLLCSERTVEDHARAGRLPGIKFGDKWVFPVESLLRAVNNLAEAEAAKRSTPAKPSAIAVKLTLDKKRLARPNLSLL